MQKELIYIPEFLALYSMSRTAFYREVKQGKITIVKRGKRTLVATEEATRWKKNLQESSVKASETSRSQ